MSSSSCAPGGTHRRSTSGPSTWVASAAPREHGLEPLWIAQGKDATGWNANELALIDAANEMYRDTMISDETWATLSARYDAHQMISIAATVANYRMVSMTLNAFGVQPLPDDELFPVLEGY